MRPLGRHVSLPLGISLVALFFALGGGSALASLIITSNGQVAQNTISGHRPPSGDHANIVGGSVNGTDLAAPFLAGLRMHCPTGLQRIDDLCFQPTITSQATLPVALQICADDGLRLPSAGELALAFEALGAPQDPEWVGSYFEQAGTLYGDVESNGSDRSISLSYAASAGALQEFRCVTTPTN